MTKPDEETHVVVMDKLHHSILLKEASVDNKDEFRSVSREQPKTSGRYYVIPIVSATGACTNINALMSARIRLLADMFRSI